MFLILLSALAIGQIEALTETEFRLEFKKCFSQEKPSLWNPGSAVSIENFIYIVEKLERNHDISTEELVRKLLTKFSCNRLELKVNDWKRVETGRGFEKIMAQFIGDSKEQLSLTDEDQCQLFFMLSQAIQKVKNSDNSLIGENNFYEHGVVSVNADNERAIDLSKVLYGILAGFQEVKTKQVRDFKDFKDEGKSKERADKKLDLLYSSTVSEVINTAAEIKSGTKEWYKGEWSSTLCPKEYIHDNEITWPTTAEVAGAVDGFVLGSRIREMENRNDLKLSQILRMYYSKEGFKKNAVDQSDISYCTRSSISLDATELVEQTINYMVVYQNTISRPALEEEENVIKEEVRRFKPAEILQQTTAEKKACETEEIRNRGKDTCETPSNVFAFLDRRGNITRQKAVLGELINEMNVGLDEDTITIYLNEDVENLKLLVNASDSKAESTCTLEEYESYGTQNTAADNKVLTDIQNILSSYEENQKSLLAVPAKVVVVFNVGDLKPEEEKNLETAARKLGRRHTYITMIPVGRNTEYLKKYFSKNQESDILSLYDSNLVPDLRERICEAPAVLQYSNCKDKSSLQETEYKGYIRDQHVQYWTMYPKDFLKTFSYKFEFKARYGNIRVCFSRGEPIRESGSPKCQELANGGNTIVFSDRDPCKGNTVHNCEPFYFSIFGRSGTNGEVCRRENDGKNVGCKRLDQIEYTISHEGISCSSAKQLISSPLFQTLLTLLITFYVLAWKK